MKKLLTLLIVKGNDPWWNLFVAKGEDPIEERKYAFIMPALLAFISNLLRSEDEKTPHDS